MKASDSENTASPRPWTWYLNQDEQLIVCDKNGNEVAQVFVGEDEAQLICNAVNGEEVSKLRNLVKRLLPYAEQRLAELHTPITPFLVEARQALEEETDNDKG